MDQKGKSKKKLQVFLDKSLPAIKRNKALSSFIGMFDCIDFKLFCAYALMSGVYVVFLFYYPSLQYTITSVGLTRISNFY
jgi:hypothetical protein